MCKISICERTLNDQLCKKYKTQNNKSVTEGSIYATIFQSKAFLEKTYVLIMKKKAINLNLQQDCPVMLMQR